MTKSLLHRLIAGALTISMVLLPTLEAHAAAARIKDIVDFEGVRENQLVGYGLVVGLNGTGDSLNNSPFTKQSLQSMLERLGVNTAGENVRTANVAAVMVTANLPPFATQGSRMDVSVAALGDADSLQGGTLLGDPPARRRWRSLRHRAGAGRRSTASRPEGDAATIISGCPHYGPYLVRRRSSNAKSNFSSAAQTSLRLALRNPDLTTARRIALAVNDFIGAPTATPENPGTVRAHPAPGF